MKTDWEHYRRVADTFTNREERIVAYYHDAVEDGWMTEAQARSMFGDEIADDIMMLTRRNGETYNAYIMRLADHGSLRAIRVKLADLRDNYARSTGEYRSLRSRYKRAMLTLEPLLSLR